MSSNNLMKSVFDVIGFVLITVFLLIQEIVKCVLPKSYLSPLKSVKDEVVLITGGGGGLGRLLALKLSKLGSIIVLWDVNQKAVDESVDLVKRNGGKAYGFLCDLTDKESVYRVADLTRKEVGNISILINNAGVVSGKFLLETPDEEIKRTFDVNIISHFWTVKAFLPAMIKQNNGHIVTIASMAGFVGISKLIDYCASKYAAVGFDESLRVELEAQGIRGVKTTAICPYFIQSTGMFGNVKARFFARLRLEDVAEHIVDSMRRNEEVVIIPKIFKIGLVFKSIVPWSSTSMFLRNLVPDAVPHLHGGKAAVINSEKLH